VILLSNYSPQRVYHKALEKDPTALDSLITRLNILEILEGEPLDIDGLLEAIATASAATTATSTTSADAEVLNATTFSAQTQVTVVTDSITAPVVITTNQELQESAISSPEMIPLNETDLSSVRTPEEDELRGRALALLPIPGTPDPRYSINEEDLIPSTTVEVERPETVYEKFQRERREQIRKQDKLERESSIDRVSRKGKNVIFTGYN